MTEHDEQVLKQAVEEILTEQSNHPLQKGLPLARIQELLGAQFALQAEMDNPEIIQDAQELNKLLLKYFRFEYGVYSASARCCF